MRGSLRIAFLHPDLGLGGAERLVVDAAIELQRRGHDVSIITLFHDPQRSFVETSDGTLDVTVHPTPRLAAFAAKPRALTAVLRMSMLARAAAARRPEFDVIFCDLVAHMIPVLRLFSNARILFYCHFPDCLLARNQDGILYRSYRRALDRLEEIGTGRAHRILVNSRFTESSFRHAFPRLRLVPAEVVYPGVALPPFVEAENRENDGVTLLSLNRFDPAKNLGLAIAALAELRALLPAATFERVRLVIAGSYDARLPEQVQTLRQLQHQVTELGLGQQIVFRRSVTDAERVRLLHSSLCLLYTPAKEHFGLGPIESMLAGRPVIGVARGGVRETVRNGETGFLCEPTSAAFAAAIARFIREPALADQMGQAGRQYAATHFSRERFGAQLDSIVRAL